MKQSNIRFVLVSDGRYRIETKLTEPFSLPAGVEERVCVPGMVYMEINHHIQWSLGHVHTLAEANAICIKTLQIAACLMEIWRRESWELRGVDTDPQKLTVFLTHPSEFLGVQQDPSASMPRAEEYIVGVPSLDAVRRHAQEHPVIDHRGDTQGGLWIVVDPEDPFGTQFLRLKVSFDHHVKVADRSWKDEEVVLQNGRCFWQSLLQCKWASRCHYLPVTPRGLPIPPAGALAISRSPLLAVTSHSPRDSRPTMTRSPGEGYSPRSSLAIESSSSTSDGVGSSSSCVCHVPSTVRDPPLSSQIAPATALCRAASRSNVVRVPTSVRIGGVTVSTTRLQVPSTSPAITRPTRSPPRSSTSPSTGAKP